MNVLLLSLGLIASGDGVCLSGEDLSLAMLRLLALLKLLLELTLRLRSKPTVAWESGPFTRLSRHLTSAADNDRPKAIAVAAEAP